MYLNYLKETDGKHIDSRPFGRERYLIEYEVPMREIIGTFYDNLLNVTQGIRFNDL